MTTLVLPPVGPCNMASQNGQSYFVLNSSGISHAVTVMCVNRLQDHCNVWRLLHRGTRV